MLTTPAVRGRHMQTFVGAIDQLPALDRGVLRERLAATLETIARASPVGWVPADLNLEATRVVSDHLGPERTRLFFRDLLLAGFKTPLLAAFVSGALRLAGSDPGAAFKWVPQGFGLVFRDCGVWSTHTRTPTSMVVEIKELPPPMRDPIWLNSVASSLSAVFILTSKQGEMRLETADAGATANLRATWRP